MSSSTGSNTSSIKPPIATETVLSVLQDYFRRPILNLKVVPGGQVATTFSFTVASTAQGNVGHAQDYFIHFNATMLVNFEKAAYVVENFASADIPIPRVVHLGRIEDVHFAISEKAAGANLLQIPRHDYLDLIPKQMEVLDAIHRVPVGNRPGYGIFDGQGIAHSPSWRAHMECVSQEEPAGDFYGHWHSLFRNSFLERDLFDRVYSHMMQLVGYCPEDRCLVHGGYGFGNVLTQAGRITAVLDWMDARYGDFLYDVAWLDFWSPDDRWQHRFRQHYHDTERTVHFYSERVLCYQCFIALDGLKFNAKGRNKAGYDFVRQRILSLLDNRKL